MTTARTNHVDALLDKLNETMKQRDQAVRDLRRIQEEMAASNEMFLRLMEENVKLKKAIEAL